MFVLFVAIYGMFLTFGLLIMRQQSVVPSVLYRQEWFARLHDSKSGIPYGIAIAIAGLQVYSSTYWFDLIR